MLKATRLAVPVLLAVMALSTAAPALAAPADPVTTHEVVTETVVWELPAGQCPNLPAGQSVVGTGESVITTDTAVYEDGRLLLTWDNTVTGTAVGSDGTQYTFYSNDHWSAYAPSETADVRFRMHGLFLLQSPAAAAQNDYALRNAYDWRWTFAADNGPFDVWPPDDLQRVTNYGNAVTDDLDIVCSPL